jgi:mono/diheme cytochrome c family protein
MPRIYRCAVILLVTAHSPRRCFGARRSPATADAKIAFLVAGAMVLGTRMLGAQASPAPLTPFAARKAEALLRGALPCLGCHQLGGEGGRVGPDLTTVRTRRTPEYIASMVTDPQRTVPGTPMPRIPMAGATRDLIIRYLSTRPGLTIGSAGAGAPAPAAPPATRSAQALYGAYCAACHGVAGRGDGPNAPYLPVKPAAHASREAMSLRSDDALFDTISGGGAIMNRSPRMPPFGETLTPGEIHALVAYIRQLCRCRGPAWSVGSDAPRSPGGSP